MSKAKKGKTVNKSRIKAKSDNSQLLKKIFSVVMIVFLGGSLFAGFAMTGFSSTGQVKYFEKHKFVYNSDSNSWQYLPKGTKERFDFDYYPEELMNIGIKENVIDYFDSYNGFFITSDPNTGYAQEIQSLQYNFGNTISKLLEKSVSLAFTKENDLDVPVMNCDIINALHAQGNDTDIGVILIRESETVGYELDGDCLIIQGSNMQDIRSLHDLYLYSVMGIYK